MLSGAFLPVLLVEKLFALPPRKRTANGGACVAPVGIVLPAYVVLRGLATDAPRFCRARSVSRRLLLLRLGCRVLTPARGRRGPGSKRGDEMLPSAGPPVGRRLHAGGV